MYILLVFITEGSLGLMSVLYQLGDELSQTIMSNLTISDNHM